MDVNLRLIPKHMLDAHKRGTFRLLNNGPENKEGLLNYLNCHEESH